jgi:hypothetical protein
MKNGMCVVAIGLGDDVKNDLLFPMADNAGFDRISPHGGARDFDLDQAWRMTAAP